MQVTVNGEPHTLVEGQTVTQLLEQLRFSFPLKTVLVNGTRLDKAQHDTTVLHDGDRVEVLHLMSGG